MTSHKKTPSMAELAGYETSQRKVSSVIVSEKLMDRVPTPEVRYVEIPEYHEVVKHISKKETREVERIVPKIVVEVVEKIVEVPQMKEVIRYVEIPQIQEIVRHVPKIEYQDRFYDVVKHVPVVEVRQVEKVVEVPGEIIEVPKVVMVEQKVMMPKRIDQEQTVIVAQTIKPIIVEGQSDIVVDVVEYEPQVINVDIHVAKFIDHNLVAVGSKETVHKVVSVPPAQYNSMLHYLNSHLTDEERSNLPYLADVAGQVHFLDREYQWSAPKPNSKIVGLVPGRIYSTGTPVKSTVDHEAELVQMQASIDEQVRLTLAKFEIEKHEKLARMEEFNNAQKEAVQKQIEQHRQEQLAAPKVTTVA